MKLAQIEERINDEHELVFLTDVDLAVAGEIELITRKADALKAKLRERMRSRYDAAVTKGRANVVAAASVVLDAYKSRFGVPRNEGENLVGPIDEEVEALAAALAALQEINHVVND